MVQFSAREKELHVVSCIKSWAAARYVNQLEAAHLDAHQVESGKMPCPLDNDVCACQELFTYSDLAFHLYARVLSRRLMQDDFCCTIKDCNDR